MSWFDLTGLCFGFGISLLASACTLGAGLAGLSRFRVCQLSWNLAILQFALLVAGWLLGVEATHRLGVWVVWADMVFVFLVAIKMFSMGKPSHVPRETSGVDRTMMLLGMTSSARILVLAWVWQPVADVLGRVDAGGGDHMHASRSRRPAVADAAPIFVIPG